MESGPFGDDSEFDIDPEPPDAQFEGAVGKRIGSFKRRRMELREGPLTILPKGPMDWPDFHVWCRDLCRNVMLELGVAGYNVRKCYSQLRGGRGPKLYLCSRWAGSGASCVMREFMVDAFAHHNVPVEVVTCCCADKDDTCANTLMQCKESGHVFGDILDPFDESFVAELRQIWNKADADFKSANAGNLRARQKKNARVELATTLLQEVAEAVAKLDGHVIRRDAVATCRRCDKACPVFLLVEELAEDSVL